MTSLFKKLNFKDQKNILCLNVPSSFEKELNEMGSFTRIIKKESNLHEIDFVIIFVTKKDAISNIMEKIASKFKGDTIIWFSYPKSSSKKYSCDFNRDHGWDELGKYNVEVVRQVAIDSDWSALRFRKVEYIKTLKRNKLAVISQEGKRRLTQ